MGDLTRGGVGGGGGIGCENMGVGGRGARLRNQSSSDRRSGNALLLALRGTHSCTLQKQILKKN